MENKNKVTLLGYYGSDEIIYNISMEMYLVTK